MDNLTLGLTISNIVIALQDDPDLASQFRENPAAIQEKFGLKDMQETEFVEMINSTVEEFSLLKVNVVQSTEEVSKLNPEAMKNAPHNFGPVTPLNHSGFCTATFACRAWVSPASASFGSVGSAASTGSRGTFGSTGTTGSVASFAGRTTNLTRAASIGTTGCIPRAAITHRMATAGTIASYRGGTSTNLGTTSHYGSSTCFGQRPLRRPGFGTASMGIPRMGNRIPGPLACRPVKYGRTPVPIGPFTMGSACLNVSTCAASSATIRVTQGCLSGLACNAPACITPPIPRTPACFASAMTVCGTSGSVGIATVGSGGRATIGSMATTGTNGGEPGGPVGGGNGTEKEFAKGKATVMLKSIKYDGDPVGDNFELRIQVGKSAPPFTWKGKMAYGKRKTVNKEVFNGTFTYEVTPDSIDLPLTITLKEIDRIDRLHDKKVQRAIINLPLTPTAGEVTKHFVDLKLTEIDEKPGDVPSIGAFSFSFWCEQLQ